MSTLQEVVDEYDDSIIQSEAEVRSKLIVPLLNALGYPSSLRAEEFPVYGFEGQKRLPTKNADFLLFSDKNFAEHRDFSHDDIEWVKEHSLLIFEAKKPGAMPKVLGQPVFYTIWTKAVAYLISDGKTIKGYYYNMINTDTEIIDCPVKELPRHDEINGFSYENILRMKGKSDALNWERKPVTEKDMEKLPEATWQLAKMVVGKGSDELSRLELMNRFLHAEDALVYRAPDDAPGGHTLVFPREKHPARLYIGYAERPLDGGYVRLFEKDGEQMFFYDNEYISLKFTTVKKRPTICGMGFHVFMSGVGERIAAFDKVRKLINAHMLRIEIDEDAHRSFCLPNRGGADEKKELLAEIDVCLDDMQKLRTIEEYYGIEFDIPYIDDRREVTELRNTLRIIFNGIAILPNCEITLTPNELEKEDTVCDEPVLMENVTIDMNDQLLFGSRFSPDKIWLLPDAEHADAAEPDQPIKRPGCCTYKLVSSEG